jgi:hypothetical protein
VGLREQKRTPGPRLFAGAEGNVRSSVQQTTPEQRLSSTRQRLQRRSRRRSAWPPEFHPGQVVTSHRQSALHHQRRAGSEPVPAPRRSSLFSPPADAPGLFTASLVAGTWDARRRRGTPAPRVPPVPMIAKRAIEIAKTACVRVRSSGRRISMGLACQYSSLFASMQVIMLVPSKGPNTWRPFGCVWRAKRYVPQLARTLVIFRHLPDFS